MTIAIKSEIDSRVVVYPLIKCLYNYGTIAVFTTNMFMARLIENELEGGFKNIVIGIAPDGDLESLKENDGYFDGKYDFLILDNIGAVDYDILIAAVTNRITEQYIDDLTYVIEDDKTRIMKFGKPAPALKQEKPSKDKNAKANPKKGKKGEEEEVEEAPIPEEETETPNNVNIDLTKKEEEVPDDEFNKWKVEKTESDVLAEKLLESTKVWCKFPSFEAIDEMEGRGFLLVPDDTTIKEFYKHLKDYVSVDERNFLKGARVKDESSSNIAGADIR